MKKIWRILSFAITCKDGVRYTERKTLGSLIVFVLDRYMLSSTLKVSYTYLFACDVMGTSLDLSEGSFSNIFSNHVVANTSTFSIWFLAIYLGYGSGQPC